MEYADFYDIALYENKNWKGCFTPKEIACNAYDYLCEFKASVENGNLSHTMQELLILLIDDGTTEALEFVDKILTELFHLI